MDISAFPKAAELARTDDRAPRWRPGLGAGLGAGSGAPMHSEVFASGKDTGGTAAALAFAMDALRTGLGQVGEGKTAGLEEKSVLWVQDTASIRLTGRPYRPGLPAAMHHRIIHVFAKEAKDALFAMEEGLRCRDLACVIGEIAGNPAALDFTASRRLSLAAEKHGVPLFLLRTDAARDLSSARMRWEVRSAPSARPRWNGAAPGAPTWHAELFRARGYAPGEWILRDEGSSLAAYSPPSQTPAPDHGDLAGTADVGSVAAG